MPQPKTLADWLADYRAGTSLRDRLPALRARLAATGAPVYLHVASEAALESQIQALQQRAAACADADALAAAMPFFGVPFAVKDNIDIAGEPTTAACPAFAHLAPRHATVVRKLLEAGAVRLAKTNLDQLATGLVGTRSPYGAPASVFAADLVSGGSGSAVAVARGDLPFALGTDTAGSGRVPAAFNGLVGLKPTPGRVGSAGVLPAFGALLIVVFNSAYGVMNARKQRVMAARVMGASRWRIFKDVLIWESLQSTFVGLRSAVSMALVIVIVAEMFIGADSGLGHRIIDSQQVMNVKDIYASILAAGALGYALNILFLLVERRIVHWSGR